MVIVDYEWLASKTEMSYNINSSLEISIYKIGTLNTLLIFLDICENYKVNLKKEQR